MVTGWEVSGQAGFFFCSVLIARLFFTVAVVVVVVVAGRRAELGADAGRICKRQF